MRHAAARRPPPLRPPLRLVAAVALLLGGCEAADYGVSAAEPWNPGGWPELEVRIDVATQRSVDSPEPSRCQVQVAFVPMTVTTPSEDSADVDDGDDDDGDDDDGDDGADDEDAPTAAPSPIASPEAPGSCAFTRLAPGDDQGPGPGDAEDNWQVAGAVIGPDAIWLEGKRHSVELVAVEVEAGAYQDGGLRYELLDCSADTFPFGDVLDLYVPAFASGGDTGGDSEVLDGRELLPELFVEDAVMVGPALALDAPLPDDGGGMSDIPWQDGVEVAWSFLGPQAELDGVAQRPEVTVKLYNQHQDREAHGAEWLVCDPDQDGQLVIPPDVLADFSVNEAAGAGSWTTNIDVHSELPTPEWQTPWGEPVQVRAHISEGTPVRFHEAADTGD